MNTDNDISGSFVGFYFEIRFPRSLLLFRRNDSSEIYFIRKFLFTASAYAKQYQWSNLGSVEKTR